MQQHLNFLVSGLQVSLGQLNVYPIIRSTGMNSCTLSLMVHYMGKVHNEIEVWLLIYDTFYEHILDSELCLEFLTSVLQLKMTGALTKLNFKLNTVLNIFQNHYLINNSIWDKIFAWDLLCGSKLLRKKSFSSEFQYRVHHSQWSY